MHAWVMWVELIGVTSKGIEFSLESHGRYRFDKYYVGTLYDPQTGQTITDRTLELLIALAIFGLLSVMSYSGLTTVLDQHARTDAAADRLGELQKIYLLMQRDFEQIRAVGRVRRVSSSRS